MGILDGFFEAMGYERADNVPQLPVPSPAPQIPMPAPSLTKRAGWQLRRHIDSLKNLMTGFGTRGDKGQAARPNVSRIPLQYIELLALWRFNAYARQFVSLWPAHATRKGWKVNDDTQDVDIMEGENTRLNVFGTMDEGLSWGRLFGGAAILIVTTDDIPPEFQGRPGEWLQQPLDLERIISVDNLVVLDRSEAEPWNYEGNIRSPNFRKPKLWQIQPNVNALVTGIDGSLIHTSRLIKCPGAKLPASWRFANFGFDDSILEPMWDQVRGLSSIDQAAYIMGQEMNVDAIKLPGLDAAEASDQATLLNAKMLGLAKSKSLVNMLLLGKDDEYVRRNINLSGWKDLKDHAREAYAGAGGIPQTIAFGDTPSGLNTDGESGRRNFFDQIATYQRVTVKPRLVQLYTALFAAKEGPTKGILPEKWAVKFESLEELTTKDRVEIEEIQAKTDEIRVDLNLMPAGHISKSRYGEAGYQFNLLPLPGVEDIDISSEELVKMRAEIEAGEVEVGAPGAVPTDVPAQETALNGAQVTAALEIVRSVGTGELTAAMAKAMLIEFFNLSDQAADAILADAGNVKPAAAPPPFGQERADAHTGGLLFVPLTPEAIVDWRRMQAQVAAILGDDFEVNTFPHVTVLFLGDLEPDQVEKVARLSAPVVADVTTWPVHTSGVGAFPAGPDGTPIILRTWGPFSELNDRLLRTLVAEINQKQFPEFRPHAMLGHLKRPLTTPEAAALLQLGLGDDQPRPWVPTEVVFRVAGVEAGRFPMTVRLDNQKAAS